jgi:hypothetical protein
MGGIIVEKKGLASKMFNNYNKKHDNKNTDVSYDQEADLMGCSDFLFAVPSFSGGMASALDMGATTNIYNYSSGPVEADIRAMRSDWIVTGKDIMIAMKRYEQTQSTK